MTIKRERERERERENITVYTDTTKLSLRDSQAMRCLVLPVLSTTSSDQRTGKIPTLSIYFPDTDKEAREPSITMMMITASAGLQHHLRKQPLVRVSKLGRRRHKHPFHTGAVTLNGSRHNKFLHSMCS